MVGLSVAFGNWAAYGTKSPGDVNQISSKPHSIWENDEKLWLYRVEDAVLMVEVKPSPTIALTMPNPAIGQVVLKRLITADQAIEILCHTNSSN